MWRLLFLASCVPSLGIVAVNRGGSDPTPTTLVDSWVLERVWNEKDVHADVVDGEFIEFRRDGTFRAAHCAERSWTSCPLDQKVTCSSGSYTYEHHRLTMRENGIEHHGVVRFVAWGMVLEGDFFGPALKSGRFQWAELPKECQR